MAVAIILACLLVAGVLMLFYGIFARNVTSPFASVAYLREQNRAARQHRKKITIDGYTRLKIFMAILFGLIFGLGTRWPVAGVFGLIVGWVAPDITGTYSKGRQHVAEVEAWEQWTSQLLHLVKSGNAIPNSIIVSARYCPEYIQEDIIILSREIENQGFLPALDNLVVRAASPYVDQIVLGLKVAYESGSKISEVFSDIEETLQKEAEIAKRAEAARQIANTQGLLSIGASFVLITLIVIINRGYLDPFDTAVGQVFLAIVAVLFSIAMFIIKQFTIINERARLIVPDVDEKSEKSEKSNRKVVREQRKASAASGTSRLRSISRREKQRARE